MAWGSGPNTSPLNGTISLEGIPNLPGYRSTPMRPQKHRQTLQIRHGSMVVIGHRDPLPGSPGSTVRLDRSIRAAPTRGRRGSGDCWHTINRAAKGRPRRGAARAPMPFPKGQPLPKWLRYGKEQLTFKAYFEEAVPGSPDRVEAREQVHALLLLGRRLFATLEP